MTMQAKTKTDFGDEVKYWTVTCEFTGKSVDIHENHWQLYESVDGWRQAAEALTKALDEACNTPGGMKAARAVLNPVMRKFDDYGARDSEPRYFADAALRELLKLDDPSWW